MDINLSIIRSAMINRLCVCALIEYRIPLQATAMGHENWNGTLSASDGKLQRNVQNGTFFVCNCAWWFLPDCLSYSTTSLSVWRIFSPYLSNLSFSHEFFFFFLIFFKEKLQILSLCPSILIVILKQFKPYLHLI